MNKISEITENEIKKLVESAEKKLKEKYNFEFNIKLVGGEGASLHPEEIWIGKENPERVMEVLIIHEAYHKIFRINQKDSFIEKDKGNPIPYFQEEMWIWNKIKEDFPELSFDVNLCIAAEMDALKLSPR
jgi:hypothetical protein